jgi:hypothetical protein
MQPLPPAGWYPDPNGSPQQRWWNGQSWTNDMAPAAAPAPVNAATMPVPAYVPHAYQSYAAASQAYHHAAPATGLERNRYALITFGIVALYIAIAVASHVVLLGILPLGMSIRSQRAQEPLAPLAIVAAIVSIVVAVTALS